MDKTHREKARMFLKKGDFKKALKLAKTFDITYNKEEVGILEIAYEIFSNRGSFYKQIGIDIELNKKKAIQLLERLNNKI